MDQALLIETITRQVLEQLGTRPAETPVAAEEYPVPVGVSVRHLHMSQADLELLFGPGAQLTQRNELYQKGEFASDQVVTVVGPRLRVIQDVRILGPLRKNTQVELSRTDCIVLGVNAPVRASGDIKGSAAITLVGPKGCLALKEGAIRANRHIHMSNEEASQFGVADNDNVRVFVPGERALTYENVQIRTGKNLRLQLHLDTDDANAAGVECGTRVKIIGPSPDPNFWRKQR